MNKFYTLEIDENLEASLEALRESFAPGERVVSTNTANDKMIITTELTKDKATTIAAGRGRSKNLLLEDMATGRVPSSLFDIKG